MRQFKIPPEVNHQLLFPIQLVRLPIWNTEAYMAPNMALHDLLLLHWKSVVEGCGRPLSIWARRGEEFLSLMVGARGRSGEVGMRVSGL
jgi:hypothetical protein